jgi:D-alanine-D-alanine ligase
MAPKTSKIANIAAQKLRMKKIAILTGGDSEERVVSLKSSQVVFDHLPKDRYRCFQIDIQGANWVDLATGSAVDKNDFTLTLPDGEHIAFDVAFAALHGSPLEDGKMQGYLDLMGVPYTCCDGYVSALTMSKYDTKTRLVPLQIPMSPSVLLRIGETIDEQALLSMGLPLFVKPNSHGSSFGVTKVKNAAELRPAIDMAFEYDTAILVEAFMPGREFSNGALRVNGEVVVLPITEIIPEDEFFTFAAKYEGRSKEVTPADLLPELTQQCQARTRKIYEALGCKGVVRIDYILVNDTFYLLEPNTIPGISPASIVPQQANAHGWSLGEFFSLLVENAMK